MENTHSIVNISHCNFTDNSADYAGGAIFTRSSLSIQRSSFMSNRVSGSGSGGAIYAAGINISISIIQSEFVDNSVQQRGSGGALLLYGSGSNILTTESSMNNNSGARCGALSITDSQFHSVKIENSILTNNSAIISGGGVACIRSATVSILYSIFSHNRARENGGVFAVDDSVVGIQGSIFDNNLAVANGGVIATKYFQAALFISYTSLLNNQGNKQGGAIYLGRKGSQVKISKSAISFNNATRGGFATVLGSSLEITSTNVFNNTAETGEVIRACNSDISVSDHLFRTTDPIYSVCTLFSGDVNATEVTTTSEALADTTTSSDTPTNTNRPIPETTTMSATISLPTEPSTMPSVYFELNGKVYLNNIVISLSEVGENENALLCKTDLVTCCATLPN